MCDVRDQGSCGVPAMLAIGWAPKGRPGRAKSSWSFLTRPRLISTVARNSPEPERWTRARLRHGWLTGGPAHQSHGLRCASHNHGGQVPHSRVGALRCPPQRVKRHILRPADPRHNDALSLLDYWHAAAQPRLRPRVRGVLKQFLFSCRRSGHERERGRERVRRQGPGEADRPASPKVRVVTVSECGSHAVVDAEIGGVAGKGAGERPLARSASAAFRSRGLWRAVNPTSSPWCAPENLHQRRTRRTARRGRPARNRLRDLHPQVLTIAPLSATAPRIRT